MKKILVWGCGSIGQRHAKNLKGRAQVYLLDADRERTFALAKEHGFAVIDSVEAIPANLDGIIIALPTGLHHEAAKKALATGAYVLIEKPICIELHEARELEKLGGAKLNVVSNMRYHAAIRALEQGISKIGKPLFARAQFGNYLPSMRPGVDYTKIYASKRSEGGGALMDCIHEIDYLGYLFGPISHASGDLDTLSDLSIEAEDYASLQLRHASGFRSELHLDYLQQFKQRGCEVIGSHGTVIWRSLGKNPEHCNVQLYTQNSGEWSVLLDTLALDINACYVDLVQDFCRLIEGEASSRLSTVREAIGALKVVHAAYKSTAERGRYAGVDEI